MKCAEAWQARETGKNTRNLVTQIDRDKAKEVHESFSLVKKHRVTKIGLFCPLFCVRMLGKSTNYSTGT